MSKIVAFTGAGISKASGVPTFIELGDLRDKLSRSYFEDNTYDFYELLTEMKKTCDNAMPNPAHLALAQYNIPVITMNIDGLHKRAGSKTLIEIHGNLNNVICCNCKASYDFFVVEQSIYCKQCNALLEPNVVLYGDSIPRYYDALELISSAEELLVVGTSFYTSTASEFVGIAKRAGIKITIINDDAENQVLRYLKQVFSS
jgi:NAD-dependent deacetylase